jgi:hypothetical protein
MKTNTIYAQVSNDSALRDGLAKNHKPSEKLALDGKEVKVGELTKMLDQRTALAKQADEARRRFRESVAAYHAFIAQTDGTVSTLRAALITRLGKTSSSLGDYGIAPRKVRTSLTVEERAFAVAKAKATRTARHTMSKKQRLDIEGDAPAQIVFGATAASTPVAATPGPAPMTAPPNVTNVPNIIAAKSNGAVTNGASTNGAAIAAAAATNGLASS